MRSVGACSPRSRNLCAGKIKQFDLPESNLNAVYNRMIAERNQRQLPPPTNNFMGIVGKEPYPIGRKTLEVMRQLVLRGVERLKNLFKGNKSRSEIVATFLAVLDLCKTNSVTLEDDVNGDNPNVRLLDEDEKKEMT